MRISISDRPRFVIGSCFYRCPSCLSLHDIRSNKLSSAIVLQTGLALGDSARILVSILLYCCEFLP